MNEVMMGEFTCKIENKGIFLPKKFYEPGEEMQLVMFQEGKWISLQLWKNVPTEEMVNLEQEHVTILNLEKIIIGEDGYVVLPKPFMEQVGSKEYVVVAGVLNHIEILTMQEMDEMEENLKDLEEMFENLWL